MQWRTSSRHRLHRSRAPQRHYWTTLISLQKSGLRRAAAHRSRYLQIDRPYRALRQSEALRHLPRRCTLAGLTHRLLEALAERRFARQQRHLHCLGEGLRPLPAAFGRHCWPRTSTTATDRVLISRWKSNVRLSAKSCNMARSSQTAILRPWPCLMPGTGNSNRPDRLRRRHGVRWNWYGPVG